MQTRHRVTWRNTALVGLLSGCLGCFLSFTEVGWWLEESFGLSWLFTLRGAVSAPPEVVIIALNPSTARQLGQSEKIYNWSRSLHVELTDKLVDAGAAIIVFDFSVHDNFKVIRF